MGASESLTIQARGVSGASWAATRFEERREATATSVKWIHFGATWSILGANLIPFYCEGPVALYISRFSAPSQKLQKYISFLFPKALAAGISLQWFAFFY